jgi:hypothetical protein
VGSVTRMCPCKTEELQSLADALIDLQLKFENDDGGSEGAVWCFVETVRLKRRLRHHCRLSELEIEQLIYERREARGIPHP